MAVLSKLRGLVAKTARSAGLSTAKHTQHMRQDYQEANITTVLLPLLEDTVGTPTSAVIVGGTGDYPTTFLNDRERRDESTHFSDPWSEKLDAWLSQGTEVEYYLVDPSPEIRVLFGELKNRYDNFHPRFIDRTKTTDKIDLEICNQLISYHPSAFRQAKDGKIALWIEGNHPPGTRVAHDCRFVYYGKHSHRDLEDIDTIQMLDDLESFSSPM